jgi:hypothetical protein
MAWHNLTKKQMWDDYFGSATLILMLLKSTYTDDPDHNYIDNGGANDPIDHECDATNYARKTVVLTATPSVQEDAFDRVTLDIDDQTWTSLGNGTNNTIDKLCVAKQITVDTDHEVVAVIPFGAHTTDGNNFKLAVSDLIRGVNA